METKTQTAPAGSRVAWIDNIRWTVIAMVVLDHACVTYSGMGLWFYKESLLQDIASTIVFSVYQTFAQAFFMGLLFFLAGTLVPRAYDRKGFLRFAGDRAVRLGIPSLVFMLLLDPLTNVIRTIGTGGGFSWSEFLPRYRDFVLSGSFLSASGPLWFAIALLAFSILYALVRLGGDALRGGTPPQIAAVAEPLASRTVTLAVLALTALIAVLAFAIRLLQPLGTSVMNMQLGFFASYVILFAAGLFAGRHGLLEAIPTKAGRTWFRLAIVIGLPLWAGICMAGGALNGNQAAFEGGLHWQAAAYALWESFFCVAFGLGLLVLYRERANVANRATVFLAYTGFGTYTFHSPILVGVSVLIVGMQLHPLAKALIVASSAWALSVAFAWVVRKIPGVGKLFA
jgi:glucans biosynthesis protein C